MDSVVRDLRHAVRGLLRAPAFTVPMLLTLTLGLGANAAVFSVVEAVLLRPLPYPRQEQLVRIFETCPIEHPLAGMNDLCTTSVPGVEDWKQQAHAFTGLAGYQVQGMSLQRDTGAEHVRATATSAGLFGVIGVSPALGRTPGNVDGDADAPWIVLSQGLWQRAFAADRNVLGQTLRLDGAAYTVAGVMPAGFDFPPGTNVDAWVPLRPTGPMKERGNHWLAVVARLARGSTIGSAQTEMSGITARIAAAYPRDQKGRGARVIPLRETVIGTVRPKLLVVTGAALLVLLIACANAASLMLARAVARRRELGVRAALGASAWRLGRQLALEALVVGIAGGVAALLLAPPAVAVLLRLAGDVVPLASGTVSVLAARVVLPLLAAAMLVSLASALLPAVHHARATRLATELQAGGARVGAGGGTRRLRGALVVAQVALSATLLVGTFLLLRTLATLIAIPTGMSLEHTVTFAVGLPSTPGTNPGRDLLPRIRERVLALPGVRAAGWTSHVPLRQWGTNGHFAIEGLPRPATPEEGPFAEVRFVSPGFLDSIGVPIRRGHDFGDADGDPRTPGVLVNQELVDRYLGARDPLGRHLDLDAFGLTSAPSAIVGVVGNVRDAMLDRPPIPTVYFPTTLGLPGFLTSMSLLVDTSLPIAETVRSVRTAIHEAAPGQAVFAVDAMPQVVARSLGDRRLVAWLLASFGAVALLLAAAGLYGLLAYLVAQSRREIGIRVALGASSRSVLGLVVGEGLRLVGIGLAVGILLAIATTGWLGSLVYGASRFDPSSLLAVAATLGVVTLLALWLPAARALRTDPALVLREES